MPVADCGVFEVGERSEVGALESPKRVDKKSPSRKKRKATFAAPLPTTLACEPQT